MSHATREFRRERAGRQGRGRVTNPYAYCVHIGFFAGLFWGGLGWILYLLHFTKLMPGFVVDPFFRLAFLKTGWGMAVGLGGFIVFSIAAAFIYYFALGRLGGPWPGVAYGLAWWCVWFLFAGPLLYVMEPVHKIGYNTLATELSLFLIWGLFIGYSIAYEFNDEATREPVKINMHP